MKSFRVDFYDVLSYSDQKKRFTMDLVMLYSHQRTNSVDVAFTSDDRLRLRGFTLDVRSTSCTHAVEACDETVREVMVSSKWAGSISMLLSATEGMMETTPTMHVSTGTSSQMKTGYI